MEELTQEDKEKASDFFASLRTLAFGLTGLFLAISLDMGLQNSVAIGLLAFLFFIRLGRS